MHRLPDPLQAVVEQFSRMPGLGPKSALRCAMKLLQWPESETKRLGQAIYDLRTNLQLCSRCGGLTDINPCKICTDPVRNAELLCLLADWDSMLTLENGGFYQGHYFILGGLLAPLDKITPDQLDLDRLYQRLETDLIGELIFALGATVEAENTASFIMHKVKTRFPRMHLSRLAQGIPLGAEVKSMDKETLRQSLQHRQTL